MLTFEQRRAELRQRVGTLTEIPLPSLEFRQLIMQFWFDTLSDSHQYRLSKKTRLFCETLLKKLNIYSSENADPMNTLRYCFYCEKDAEKVLTLVEVSFWVLGILEKHCVNLTITKLNLAL
ncbi:MAG: hypothetical protein AAF892_10535 [Cyanobacteria bacterium P01_D01_bin.71]